MTKYMRKKKIANINLHVGPIYKLNLGGATRVIISSVELMDEICNEERFVKAVAGGPLMEVRNGIGDGLFTAHHGEKNWGVAHRILMPAFGPLSIQGMFDGNLIFLTRN